MYGHHQYTILGPPPYTSCLPSPYTHSPECLQRLQDGVYRLVSGGGQVGLAVAVGGGHHQGGGLRTGVDGLGGVREGRANGHGLGGVLCGTMGRDIA